MKNIQQNIQQNIKQNIKQNITLIFFYINNENEIYTIKKKKEVLSSYNFSQERQMEIIKENQYNIFNKHKLISLSYFNFNVNDNEIDDVIKDKIDKTKINNYLHKLEIVDNITFDLNSDVFDKINSVFYIYKIIQNSQNTTRKVIINEKKKKTRRA